jgi:hypothetical protein
LEASEIGFIAKSLTTSPDNPKEFDKICFSIMNKRILQKFSYKQKKETFEKIFTQYGIAPMITRFSLIGHSVLEIYAIKENIESISARMLNNGWSILKFDPEETPVFSTMEQATAQKEALIRRIAYLYTGTNIKNLQKAFLIGIGDENIEKILNLAEGIRNERYEKQNGLKDKEIFIKGKANTKLASPL